MYTQDTPFDTRVNELDGFNCIVHGREAIYIANKNDAYVGRSLCHYGEYGEQEFDLLRAIVKPGMCVVEVGANSGPHTVRLAKIVGLGGRILAIEPQPPIFQALAGTIALNHLMNVDCYPYILSDKAGFATLPAIDYRLENNFGGLAFSTQTDSGVAVPCRTLDDIYVLPRLDFLKIDVEGMELEVLKGGAKTVERFKPVIYLENDRREKSQPVLEWLQEAGYRMWWHFPQLFNPKNFFENSANIFGGAQSLNVLALPAHVTPNLNLPEITDTAAFPATTIQTSP